MIQRLGLKESFTLYGVFLGVIFVVFVVGMLVGKDYFLDQIPVTEGISFLPSTVENVKPDLEFYQSLMQSSDPKKKQELSDDHKEVVSSDDVPASQVNPKGQEEEKEKLRKLYTVQVGALTVEEDAQEILNRLENKGYPGILRVPSGEDRYYRIWVGQFQGVKEARNLEKRLREDGFLTYLKKLTNEGQPFL